MKRSPSTQLRIFQEFFEARLQHLHPEEELVWVSTVVPTEALRSSYPLGIFPWPGDDPNVFPWVSPLDRGVLPLEKFHLGKSTRRLLKRSGFTVTFNTAFEQMIQACHHAHAPESWIHPKMQAAYIEAHHQGFAHSVETWQDGKLVGGLYGIDSPQVFSGESMFHSVAGAGKAAVAALVERERERGRTLLDIQQLTPHMEAMGAEAWTREQYLEALGLRFPIAE